MIIYEHERKEVMKKETTIQFRTTKQKKEDIERFASNRKLSLSQLMNKVVDILTEADQDLYEYFEVEKGKRL